MLSRMIKMSWLLVLVGVSFTFLVPCAFGISYKYVSPNFEYVSNQYPQSGYLTAELELSAPLQSNFSGALDLTILPGFFLSLSDGNRSLTSNTPDVNPLFCYIYSTDNQGLPNLWSFAMSAQIAPDTYLNMASGLVTGMGYDLKEFYQKFDSSQVVITTGGIESGFSNSFVAGPDSTGWSSSSAVPEPSSIILYGISMIGLIGICWRKRKS